jgi:NAD(P)H-dependent FMN reductase
MYHLKIISSTVRPERKGPIVTEWIAEKARNNGNFNVEVLDLKEMDLPLMDEPLHPRFKKYEQEHTRRWSAKVEEADAFIFVTAEYDHNYPAPLRNALEFLYSEWGYKAAGIVSYGGVSAGTRAAKTLSGDLTSFRIVPLVEAVNIPFFTEFIEDGKLVPNEIMKKASDTMLKELARWTKGMMVIRGNT